MFFILPAFKRKTNELLSLITPLYMLRTKCYLYLFHNIFKDDTAAMDHKKN